MIASSSQILTAETISENARKYREHEAELCKIRATCPGCGGDVPAHYIRPAINACEYCEQAHDYGLACDCPNCKPAAFDGNAIMIECWDDVTHTTPEEKEHAECEPMAHDQDCDCEACEQARKEEAYQRAVEWNALFADLKRKRRLRNQGPSWKSALAGAALLTALLLPTHASAQQFPYHTGASVIIHGSDCRVTHAWEDGSAIAHCRDHTVYAYDPDGSPTSAPGTWARVKQTHKGPYGR